MPSESRENVYFLPLITESGEFSTTVDESFLRLKTGTIVSPVSQLKLYNRLFYRASVTIDDVTYDGYVPVDFTVTMLSEDFASVTFSLVTVKETKVYNDSALTVELKTLAENETVRLIETKDGVSKIGYKIDDEWLIGYVSESAIIKTPNTVIRNVLVILAVCLSLTVTGIYFLLRKKN